MLKLIDKIIHTSFYLLFFLTPLLFFQGTSETFEFTKTIFLYFSTVVITGATTVKLLLTGRKPEKTPLNLPFLLFIASQGISTLLSIDPHTSVLGYYSRFNGGLLSTICYFLLYLSFVTSFTKEEARKFIIPIISSSVVIALIGVLEHFGIYPTCLFKNLKSDISSSEVFTRNCWNQKINIRVFSTFGQPNWLAAWIVAVIPLSFFLILSERAKRYLGYGLFMLFFAVLLFTRSRSGILGFIGADLVFATYLVLKKVNLKDFLKVHIIALLFVTVFGTPWTQPLFGSLKASESETEIAGVTALENEGTSSAEIRKIVWKGALEIWKSNPLFGTGVETFAYSYYNRRPIEHNLTTEWEYLYNKAHNEYLNLAANTGTFGLLSYLLFVGSFCLYVFRNLFQSGKVSNDKDTLFSIALLAGFTSILVTNFFGFSVVPISILFYLYPAISFSDREDEKTKTPGFMQKAGSLVIVCAAIYAFIMIINYWSADYYYNQARIKRNEKKLQESRDLFLKSINLSNREPVFWINLSQVTGDMAISSALNKNTEDFMKFGNLALAESQFAKDLSPRDVNIRRTRATLLMKLTIYNPDLLNATQEEYRGVIALAPTDPKLLYNYSVSFLLTKDYSNAIETMKKAIELKPDYKEARYALGLMYEDVNEKGKAISEFEYILNNIDSAYKPAIDELEEIGK